VPFGGMIELITSLIVLGGDFFNFSALKLLMLSPTRQNILSLTK